MARTSQHASCHMLQGLPQPAPARACKAEQKAKLPMPAGAGRSQRPNETARERQATLRLTHGHRRPSVGRVQHPVLILSQPSLCSPSLPQHLSSSCRAAAAILSLRAHWTHDPLGPSPTSQPPAQSHPRPVHTFAQDTGTLLLEPWCALASMV